MTQQREVLVKPTSDWCTAPRIFFSQKFSHGLHDARVPSADLDSALINQGCHNKLPYWAAYTTEIDFLVAGKAVEFRIKVLANSILAGSSLFGL